MHGPVPVLTELPPNPIPRSPPPKRHHTGTTRQHNGPPSAQGGSVRAGKSGRGGGRPWGAAARPVHTVACLPGDWCSWSWETALAWPGMSSKHEPLHPTPPLLPLPRRPSAALATASPAVAPARATHAPLRGPSPSTTRQRRRPRPSARPTLATWPACAFAAASCGPRGTGRKAWRCDTSTTAWS